MKKKNKVREEFKKGSIANYVNGYNYSVAEEYNDILNDLFKQTNDQEKIKSDEEPVTFDERIKRFELDSEAIHIFTQNAELDRHLKKRYAFWVLLFLGLQLIAFNVIFILIGCNVIKYNENTINLYVTGGIIEIISLVAVIINYLFKDNISKSLNNVLEKNRTNK